jgi:rubrerythrin
MSVFYGVRLTDEISARIEATGRGKSAVIQAALDAYFEGKQAQAEKPQAKQMITRESESRAAQELRMLYEDRARREKKAAKPKEKAPCDHHAIGDDEPIAREIESAREAEVEEPAVLGGCRKHPNGGGFPKAGGWWCPQCGKIV